MAVGYLSAAPTAIADRVRRTVALVRKRGYALPPARLAAMCLGGPLAEKQVLWAVAGDPHLEIAEGLVVERVAAAEATRIRRRAVAHDAEAAEYVAMTRAFVATLVAVAPFVQSVSIAGSLATGGFRASDDIDLNLIVDDGHRHLAYVLVNLLGVLHALRYRGKPVDDLTRRPIAPRLMTANLILERSQCLPLERQDDNMAFELLVCEPVYGLSAIQEVIDANPGLVGHFPQLEAKRGNLAVECRTRLPKGVFPRALDQPARLLGEAAWRYMQWTRRARPDALARVAYVRATMRPYALFDRD